MFLPSHCVVYSLQFNTCPVFTLKALTISFFLLFHLPLFKPRLTYWIPVIASWLVFIPAFPCHYSCIQHQRNISKQVLSTCFSLCNISLGFLCGIKFKFQCLAWNLLYQLTVFAHSANIYWGLTVYLAFLLWYNSKYLEMFHFHFGDL